MVSTIIYRIVLTGRFRGSSALRCVANWRSREHSESRVGRASAQVGRAGGRRRLGEAPGPVCLEWGHLSRNPGTKWDKSGEKRGLKLPFLKHIICQVCAQSHHALSLSILVTVIVVATVCPTYRVTWRVWRVRLHTPGHHKSQLCSRIQIKPLAALLCFLRGQGEGRGAEVKDMRDDTLAEVFCFLCVIIIIIRGICFLFPSRRSLRSQTPLLVCPPPWSLSPPSCLCVRY